MRSLVIVESPAKAKTINKILGKEYSVKASVGHVRDLPEKDIGVDVDRDFQPRYQVIKGKERVISELRKAARKADRVYLAPDPDREGEAIAWHIAEEIRNGKKEGTSSKGGNSEDDNIYRVTFNEITEKAVLEAMKKPGRIDLNKVDAQQARRILDRLVGYNLSPLLWRKVRKGLSAGRVQSVAVRLVVDREREIEAFTPVEYWSISGLFKGSVPPEFHARLYRYDERLVINRDKNEFLLGDEGSARALVEELKTGEYQLKGIERRLKHRNPSPPFITSSLQQEASRRLRFSPKRTMMVAQQLYEGVELGGEGSVGLITYMRTDSTRVAEDAKTAAIGFIRDRYGDDYLPKSHGVEQRGQKKSKHAQDAHEAIRPTYLNKPPEEVKRFLPKDQLALYTLIWQRFIASHMASAKIEQTTFIITGREGKAEFRITGDVIKFRGFMAVYTESVENGEEDKDEKTLPPLSEGEPLTLSGINTSQHFTQPPPRYTEASLVKALEEKGIGRPSTYAAILSTIQDRKYVRKDEGKLVPTELGTVVNDLLVERFPELIDIGFTAKMEDELDGVEEGRLKWVRVVRKFYKPFKKDLTEAMSIPGKVRPKDEFTDILCEVCGLPMVKRWGMHGRFLACTGYPECKNTKPLEEGNGRKEAPEDSGIKCPRCSAPMLIKQGRYGRFLACSRYPECKETMPLGIGVKCPVDGGDIIERKSRKGKVFWSCSNWPRCRFASWYRPVSEKCPECGSDYLIVKRDRSGTETLSCPARDCKYTQMSYKLSAGS